MPAAATWSLITVSHNSALELSTCWRPAHIPADVQWIVVDNASTDGSAMVARDAGAEVLRLPRNVGFAAANNIGYRHASGAFIAFVNPDVEPRPESLAPLMHQAAASNALVAPQLVNRDGSPQPNGRGMPFLTTKLLHRLMPSRTPEDYRLIARDNEVLEVAWLTGAMVAASREVFDELGPWDERFFLYFEDCDLGLRAARRGFRSLVLGSERWVHGWKRESAKFNSRASRQEMLSAIQFYRRYPDLLWPGPPHRFDLGGL